jgi:ATP-dependent Lon protease
LAETQDKWIPLFPLEMVLLPQALAPLHIFEPRYRAMVRHCQEGPSPFGIVLAQDGKMSQIGCEAAVLKTLQSYPDGRFDILVRGGSRFGVRQVREHGDGYLEGLVSLVEDLPEIEDPQAQRDLLHLYREVQRLLEEEPEESPPAPGRNDEPAGAEPGYTFGLATALRLDAEERQRLLETISERERERMLIRHLAQALPAARQAGENRRRARGNGRLGSEAQES